MTHGLVCMSRRLNVLLNTSRLSQDLFLLLAIFLTSSLDFDGVLLPGFPAALISPSNPYNYLLRSGVNNCYAPTYIITLW